MPDVPAADPVHADALRHRHAEASDRPTRIRVDLDALDEALALAARDGASGLCVIGGGEVYAMTLPRAARLHLTHVDTVVDDCDAFFPEVDPVQWRAIAREPHAADERHAFAFDFVDYARI